MQADTLRQQITGNFTGTTDEILQWVACKWGVSPDLVRAEAVVESYWKQSQAGDYTNDQTYCPPGTWDGQGCYQSYGILQIKYYYFKGAWPMSRDDTAFNAEYVYGILRACYEGWTTYLSDDTPLPGYPAYHAGDIWGCIGRWYSGDWYSQDAVSYIQQVKTDLADKTWLQTDF
jgi:autotransporter family porin